MDVLFVLDTSGSMRRAIETCKKSVIDVVEKIKLQPNNRAGFFVYTEQTEVVFPLSPCTAKNVEEMKTKVSRVKVQKW